MTIKPVPQWALRLRAEREARGWNKHEMARRLMAADGLRRGSGTNLARQILDWEKGKHFPRDWAPAYAAVFDLDEGVLFAGATSRTEAKHSEDSADDVVDLAGWLEQTNVGDGTIGYLETATRRLAFD